MGIFDFLFRKKKSSSNILDSSPALQQQKMIFDAMAALCEGGLDADEFPNGEGEFGLIATNPIPCRTIFGSTAYLGRLRAADGQKVNYDRIGSTTSPTVEQPIDMYLIKHPSGQELATLYISPYQRKISSKPPRGFILAENSFSHAAPVRNTITELDGTVKYYSCGVLHRDDGPAVIEVYPGYDGPERHRSWYRFGVLDRVDGPAVIGGRTTNGQYEWWKAGVRHRDFGPAVIEIFESYIFGGGPVYEWWENGQQQKVQDGDGILYYFKDGNNVLTELPDGCRIINRGSDYRFEDADGNDLGDPPYLEAYEGYLEQNESFHEIYKEPESTFEKFNPLDNDDI